MGEIFCGAGGVGLGFHSAGFTPIWGIDMDADACTTYRNNVGHAICSRAENVDFTALERPDGLAFGFPCNDFSLVGERKGTGGYFGGLFREAVRALNEVQPTWFMAENVPGLMSAGGDSILSAFADAGPKYTVAVHLYRFEDYGVPQRRWRIVAIGIKKSMGIVFRPPVPTHSERPVSAREALKGVSKVRHNNERTKHPARTIELLSSIPEGENAWHDSVPSHLRLNVKNCKLSLIYRRLKASEPAYTVVAAGGGGTHMYHYEEPRALTNRERARLQTFPDDFIFHGSAQSVRKQIGMAVPPLGAQVIATSLKNTLSGNTYESIDPSFGYIDAPHGFMELVS